MKTKENLKAAFAGESQANRKYLAYAEKAEKDGYAQVAKLFRAVAAAETIHAHAHLKAMDGVASTVDNLVDAAPGEKHEFAEMYPPFVAAAEAEGDKRAALSMRYAMEVEKIHHGLFNEALNAVKKGGDLASAPVYVCEVCGHTVVGEPPETCPVCNARKKRYAEVE
jgi:rubrerythrin